MTPIVTGAANFQIKAAGLDSDGDSDLAIADPGATAAVLFCQEDGTFAPALTLRNSQGSRWLAIGDFDGDGFRHGRGRNSLSRRDTTSSAGSDAVRARRDTRRFDLQRGLPVMAPWHSPAPAIGGVKIEGE